MPDLREIVRGPLTREQYVGVLGQAYHLWVSVPLALRTAADNSADARVAQWMRQFATVCDDRSDSIADDLSDLRASIPTAASTTGRLLDRIHEVAGGDDSLGLLGLCEALDVWSLSGLRGLVPRGVNATRFVTRFAGARGVDSFVATLSPDDRGTTHQHASVFGHLLTELICSAAGVSGAVHVA